MLYPAPLKLRNGVTYTPAALPARAADPILAVLDSVKVCSASLHFASAVVRPVGTSGLVRNCRYGSGRRAMV